MPYGLYGEKLLGQRFPLYSSYVIFPLGSACLSSNDEINGDTRIIFNLYVAEEDIPLPKGISIDIKAKEPKLNPRSPPYGLRNYMPKKR